MITTVILVCAKLLASDACTIKTADEVVLGKEVTTQIECMMSGMFQAINLVQGTGKYAKILCNEPGEG